MKKFACIWLGVLASVFTLASPAQAEIGDLTKDLVFTPVAPCRILDTRPASGGSGAIATGGTKVFAVAGLGDYRPQGGANSNCGMESYYETAAIAVYLTVVSPAAGGWITAFPQTSPLPLAATVNFKAGDVLGNTTIVKVSPGSGALGLNAYLNIYASSSTHVVGDVVGYYSRPRATALDCYTTTTTNVTAPANLQAVATAPVCASGYTSTATNCNTTSSDLIPYAWYEGACAARNFGATTPSLLVSRRCCRIPGTTLSPP
jgi:hypothetical protein